MYFLQLFISIVFAILFLQSGLDKVFNWNDNLQWLKGHFSKTPLKNMVAVLLAVLTVLEVLAGALSAIGFVFLLYNEDTFWAYNGLVLSAASLVALFFGQRMAKDYAGAGGLVPYMVLCAIGLAVFACQCSNVCTA